MMKKEVEKFRLKFLTKDFCKKLFEQIFLFFFLISFSRKESDPTKLSDKVVK